MTDRTVEQLRAADPAAEPKQPPAFAMIAARVEARPQRRPLRSRRGPRIAVAVAAAAIVLVASLSVTDRSGGPSRLGVLDAAAASARSDVFFGYVEDTRIELGAAPGSPAHVSHVREAVRRLSATQYEGSIQGEGPSPDAPAAPAVQTDATVTRKDGASIYTWQRPYGTLFSGALRPGQLPARTPTDPEAARDAVASWATGTAPTGGDAGLADLLREAYGHDSGTQLALGYAELVLTAPRVPGAVRAAVYDALADVPGVRVEPHATDPAGRPAAALLSTSSSGPTHTQHELFIDPGTSRVHGSRDSASVDPDANASRPKDQPPYAANTTESVYRYDG